MSDGQPTPPADTPQPEGTPGVTPPPPAGATPPPPPGATPPPNFGATPPPPPGAPGAYPQQGFPQQGYPAAPGVQPMNPTDEKTWSILLHLGPIIVSFLVPLIGYLVLKDRGPFIRHNAVQALNFTLTMLIGYVASYLLMLVLIGFITLPIVWVLSIVFAIIAAVKTNKGEYYTYPFSIKFVK